LRQSAFRHGWIEPVNALPLFHRIAGQPVIVLGLGEGAEAKRRLVERAGGRVVDSIAEGIDTCARLAFIAYDDEAAAQGAAIRLRCAGVLVNVVDRPALCDFTVPSLVDRDPVLIAVGTGGASAGLAKAVRLRLERIIPQGLGQLATALQQAREEMRARWPSAAQRRRALDAALDEGGALDPLREDAVAGVSVWLSDGASAGGQLYEFTLHSDDPDDLTLRQARLLGQADAVLHDAGVDLAILTRARADAVRLPLGASAPDGGIVVILRRA
jgi:uroporphyrin-III C-methyltransferase/precorrin-2 dehydrogenase/sirohydrochlorin ferrochelatase